MAISIWAVDGVEVSAQRFRQASAAQHGGGSGRQLGGRSGFRVGTPSNVLTATSTTWTLGPCAAMLDPGATLHQGMYGWANDSNITGTGDQGVQAADATYDRKDIVYIQLNDADVDGSGAKSAPVLYLAGTASATPAAPALPARSLLVGTITVPKAGGGNPTVQLNTARYVAAGAPLPVFSQSERDALTAYDGLTVRRMDLPGRSLEVHDGTAWRTARRHARYTAIAGGTSPVGTTGAGVEWGFTTFTNSTPATSNNTFSTASGLTSKITLSEAGAYYVVAKGRSETSPGYFYISVKKADNTYVYGDGRTDGDWGATAPAIITIDAPTDILFGLRTGNAVKADVTVDILKVAD